MDNFNFLKSVDKNLYKIILEAENLYRDEYFEQCITLTRKFGENVCKNLVKDLGYFESSFDDMLATLKDKATKSIQEKEFIEDLYFLKREGNNSVHSSTVKNDGIVALECLQRAFEIAINYVVHYKKTDTNILKKSYDVELLVTGKKSKKSLAEKFQEKKAKGENKTKQPTVKKKDKVLSKKITSRISFFRIFLIFSIIISSILVLTMFLLTLC